MEVVGGFGGEELVYFVHVPVLGDFFELVDEVSLLEIEAVIVVEFLYPLRDG